MFLGIDILKGYILPDFQYCKSWLNICPNNFQNVKISDESVSQTWFVEYTCNCWIYSLERWDGCTKVTTKHIAFISIYVIIWCSVHFVPLLLSFFLHIYLPHFISKPTTSTPKFHFVWQINTTYRTTTLCLDVFIQGKDMVLLLIKIQYIANYLD